MKLLQFIKSLTIWRGIWLSCIFFCMMLYLYMDNLLDWYVYRGQYLKESYFVNTTGCRMLGINPEEANEMIVRLGRFNCTQVQLFKPEIHNGHKYLALSKTTSEILDIFNMTNISNIECTYMAVKRKTDLVNIYQMNGTFHLRDKKKYLHLKPDNDIIRIKCQTHLNKTIYHDVLFFPPALKPITADQRDSNRMSVMILGLDSISHMHYLRSMTKTAEFIKQLPHVEFWGYNRVGENSYPNVVPLLSGMRDVELEASCYKGEPKSYDECDLIWKHYKAAGFATVISEDTSLGATFNYLKGGFKRQPVDYYLRPIMLEINKHTRYAVDSQNDIYCTGARLYAEVHYEFIDGILPLMKQQPFFTFLWSTQGVHDYLYYAEVADVDYLHLLQKFQTEGILNNTFIFFVADHGIRNRFDKTIRSHMYLILEKSNPMLITLYPEWFAEKYPLAIQNLNSNAHSLITTYDMHETLKDLISLDNLGDDNIRKRMSALEDSNSKLPRGISLFLPVPDQRNCEMAGIPTHFCLCNTFKELSTFDSRIQRAARFTVRTINELLAQKPECSSLVLSSVLAGYLLENSLNDFRYEVKVCLKTLPGGGQFESTVRFTGYEMAVNGVITRINHYGNQSYCIQDFRLEKYCYCL